MGAKGIIPRWRLEGLWSLIFFLGSAASIMGQGDVTFEVNQANWALRRGAPMPLLLEVKNSTQDIQEGSLEIVITDFSGSSIGQFLFPDQVLIPGVSELEFLLPIQGQRFSYSLGVECRLVAKGGKVFLGNGTLIPVSKCSFVVPIVGVAETGISQTARDDYEWLRLETLCPGIDPDNNSAPMLTILERMSPLRLPRDPLKHMAHDLVVLEPSGLEGLSAAQITALESWVQAGGALYVVVGEKLSKEQQAFMDRLNEGSGGQLDSEVEGTDLVPIIRDAHGVGFDYGFGRVWLTTTRSKSTVSVEQRRSIAGELWRLRSEHRTSLERTGTLTLSLAVMDSRNLWQRNGYQPLPGLNDQSLRNWGETLMNPRSNRPGEFLQALLPKDVRAVPFSLMGMLVVIYIALIGFGEYFVLGRLRRRRWTWFTFPLITFTVTLLTIGMARGYLGSTQEKVTVEFRDVLEDGRVARTQRCDLIFPASSGRYETQLSGQLFTAVARQNLFGVNQRPDQMSDAQSMPPTWIRGMTTGEAVATQNLDQWKPQLNRMVGIPKAIKIAAPIETLREIAHNPMSGRTEPSTIALQQAFPRMVAAVAIRDQGVLQWLKTPSSEELSLCMTMVNASMCPDRQGPYNNPLGLFTLFEQISPAADTGLADLVIAVPGTTVVCVITREADGAWHIDRWRFPAVNPRTKVPTPATINRRTRPGATPHE